MPPIDCPVHSHRLVEHLGPLDRCPVCRGRAFVVGESPGAVVFECLGCDTLWRYQLGYAWPVGRL